MLKLKDLLYENKKEAVNEYYGKDQAKAISKWLQKNYKIKKVGLKMFNDRFKDSSLFGKYLVDDKKYDFAFAIMPRMQYIFLAHKNGSLAFKKRFVKKIEAEKGSLEKETGMEWYIRTSDPETIEYSARPAKKK
jgi:hypothetical protein